MISVKARGQRNTHHVSLEDHEGNVIGIIVSDSKGLPDPTYLNRSPVDRTAMKTTSGTSKYSDFQPPYSPIVQDSWEGGRAQADFEKDVTKFADSFRMTTRRPNRAFLGAQETPCVGIRTAMQDVPGSVTWTALIGTTTYLARKFTPTSNYTVTELWLLVAKRGTPTDPLTINLMSDNSGVPGSVLVTKTISISDDNDTFGIWRFVQLSRALTSGTTYWIQVNGSQYDTSVNHWRVGTNTIAYSNTVTRQSTNVLTAGKYDDEDAGINYVGIWSQSMYAGPYNNTSSSSTNAGDYITLNWGGEQITVIYTRRTNGSYIDVYIDDVFITTIDTRGTLAYQQSWVSVTYPAGSHTLKLVRNIGGRDSNSNMEFDAINIAGNAWSVANNDLYYRAVDSSSPLDGHFFDYKGAKYFVTQPSSGAPKLYINGDRGTADANTGALTTTVDATKSWVTGQWAGAVVIIVGGTGKTEATPWRVITDNTATNLVHSAWTITHDTTTEYVIVGSNYWTQITGHGLTKPVQSVLVSSKGVVYFTQGDTTNIRRMRAYTNSGNWTYEYADDSTNKGSLMIEGAAEIWVAMQYDSNGDTSVTYGVPKDWGTDLVLATNVIIVGTQLSRITGLEIYIDDDGTEALWVFKEDEAGFIKSAKFISLQLREMRSVKSIKNGASHLVFNTYLYWSLLNGLEQYYRPNLDDMGPNVDEGLPEKRQGPIASMIGYPGRILAAVNAGATSVSSILSYDGGGWHEEYRSIWGKPITDISFHVIPGTTTPDRLYFTQGSDMYFIPFPSETTNPVQDSNYTYTHEGVIELSTMVAGMADATKFVKSIKVAADNLSPNSVTCEIDYKLDDADTWTTLPQVIDTSPVQEIDLKEQFGLSGKRLQFRLRFQTNDNSITPVLRVIVIEALTRVSNKFAYNIPFVFEDNALDLQGRPDDIKDPQKKIDLLNKWATDTMVRMRCIDPLYDDKLVFVLPIPSRAIVASNDNNSRKYQGQLTLQDA